MRILFRLAMLAVALVLAVFAMSNRGTVVLGLWPLPDVVELPLYLVILGALLVGFLVGELFAWLAGRHWRREVRRASRRIAGLERDLAACRGEAAAARLPSAAEMRPPTRLAG